MTFGRAHRRNATSCAATLAAGLALAACGGSSDSPAVAVYVGDAKVTRADVAHRVSVMTFGQSSSAQGGQTAGTLKAEAIAYLISAQWVIQEAVSESLPVSRQEVERRLAANERSQFPDGAAELQDFLKQTGQTVADLRLAVEVELAKAKIVRRSITERVPPVTDAETAAYYKRHRSSFGLPELREVHIIDRKSWAEADAVKKRVERGTNFASISRIERATGPRGTGGHPPVDSLEEAIDAAKPHTLVGPVKYRIDYLVFELERIVPARYRPFSEVQESIRHTLQEESRRRKLARFILEWRGRWHELTKCEPGYVVPKCSQYGGPHVAEDPQSLT